MFEPPRDSRQLRRPTEPTWRAVLAGYALLAAVGLSLWAASNPIAGAAVLAVIVASVVIAQRAAMLYRCFSECGGFSLVVGRRVRITVAQPSADDLG